MNDCKSKLKENEYFIHIPIAPQLKYIFETFEPFFRKTSSERTKIKDTINANICKKFKFPEYSPLSLGIDGVPVGNSSTNSIIPAVLFINDLSPKTRNKLPVPTLIYSGHKKPNANQFLKPLVDEISNLNSNPISWFGKNNISHSTKILITCMICDAPARSWIQNFSGHNSYYGCNWCTLKANYEKNAIRYQLKINENDLQKLLRSKNQISEICNSIENLEIEAPHLGVKGYSVLSKLPNFDIINCFTPEVMHSGFLGIAKKFLSVWLNSEFKDKEFYLGLKKKELNIKLSSIRPPNHFYRFPRKFDDFKHLKSIEFELFIMYYFVYVFKNIMKDKYFNHFCKFIYAISKLNKRNIDNYDINSAKCEIFKFVNSIPKLYEDIDKLKLYNCHIILHYP